MFWCVQMPPRVFSNLETVTVSYKNCNNIMILAKASCYFWFLYNLKSASSSLELPMFVVLPKFCKHTHTHTHNMITIPFRLLFWTDPCSTSWKLLFDISIGLESSIKITQENQMRYEMNIFSSFTHHIPDTIVSICFLSLLLSLLTWSCISLYTCCVPACM